MFGNAYSFAATYINALIHKFTTLRVGLSTNTSTVCISVDQLTYVMLCKTFVQMLYVVAGKFSRSSKEKLFIVAQHFNWEKLSTFIFFG